VTVTGHAGHLIAAAFTTAGLCLAARVSERRPAARSPGARSRREWERSLFGLPSREGVAFMAATSEMRSRRRWAPADAAGAFSLLAGAIHLAVLPEHISESLLFAGFFLGSGFFQIATGFALRSRRSPRLVALVAAVNAGIVVLWALSRTKGLPLGPEPWTAESVGALDVIATACEVGVIVGVARMRSLRRI
jgi:hypothetical protein